MANRYFSQYLLNKGILTADNVSSILAECRALEPDLSMMALEKGMIDAEQALELWESSNACVKAVEKGYLTPLDLDNLKKDVPNSRACLGQVIFTKKIVDLPRLSALFKENDDAYCYPVNEVFDSVLRSHGVDAEDYEHVRDYVELFLDTIQKFLHTNALLVQGDNIDTEETTYLTYQSMGGALTLTAGCRMPDDVLLAFSKRFSDGKVVCLDDMAVDSIEEFCNVLNGLYIVNMSGKSQDMDLDMPQTVKNVEPKGDNVLQLKVETELGGFMLYLSMSGFVFEDSRVFTF